MSHDHTHTHTGEQDSYYLDQLCTLGFSAALGVIMILLYAFGKLEVILASTFHLWVLAAGIVLLIFVAIRAVALWAEVGKAKAAIAHDHHHDREHSHDNAHCDHDHDHDHDREHEHQHAAPHTCAHGHEHGWAPWRYAVLLLPIIYFLMNPWPEVQAEPEKLDANVIALSFSDAENAAISKESRDDYTIGEFKDNQVRLKGMFQSGNGPTFGLYRLKMVCCAADASPINIVIVAPKGENITYAHGTWVRVIGKLTFHPGGDGRYVTVLKADKVEKIAPDPNPYSDKK
jgi:hypothetical protein